MKNKPKTIKIFLLEGESTGVRTIEISGWTGKGFIIPRNNLNIAMEREDLRAPCIYFLVGGGESGGQKVYIGESENFVKRVKSHHKDKRKDFWNVAICFISKDETLNKAYIKYLESSLFKDVKKAGRARVISGKSSNPARLSESDKADADEFAENIKILLSASGFSFIKDPTKEDKNEYWYCKGKDASAKGMFTTEGFVVFKDSIIQGSETKTLHKYVRELRKKIIGEKIVESNDSQKLKNNTIFGSPSTAAAFVLGRNANGWTEWKNEKGKTLDEVKRI